jgi:chromosome partitioning protein
MVNSNAMPRPFVIVLGNEKGGTGKSTVSMHLIVHLLGLGFRVGSLDTDARQGTLTRYIENRLCYMKIHELDLPFPQHIPLPKSTKPTTADMEADETERFEKAVKDLQDCDFIVIDTPGTDSFLSRLAHSRAHLLITPLNDSFIDLDMLARVDESGNVVRPSTYAEMVWDQKKQKALRREPGFDWLVLRNRLGSIRTKNKAEMKDAIDTLSKRIGFRVINGFGERVIFRELFLKGLTVLDVKKAKIDMTVSHVAARQELRMLLQAIQIPVIDTVLSKAS